MIERDRSGASRPFSPDVLELVRPYPYLALAKPPGALRTLERQVELGEDCAVTLLQYPRVQVEILEFFYISLRCLGALDVAFLDTLLVERNWRVLVCGAWLALLEPRREFLRPLAEALGHAPPYVNRVSPYNRWLVELALSTIRGGSPPPEHAPIADLVARLRALLAPVPRPKVRLRLAPSAAQAAHMKVEREQIRACYHAHGFQAARALMDGTLMRYYLQDHATWLHTGAPDPPWPRPASMGSS